MQLRDIVERVVPPGPWSEGDNIPWHEPGFSERMLREHLSQAHDAASRRSVIIDQHAAWIDAALLGKRPSRVLDLGCGPGLYAQRLAALGHACTGIDYSPASITYARQQAEAAGLACTYQLADLRHADFGQGYLLAMLLYGEANVFRPEELEGILRRAGRALAPGGRLLLEPHTFAAVEGLGHQPAVWSAHPAGLFSDRPHLLLEESFWDAASQAATTRYFVIDAASGAVTRHAQTLQAYTDAGYAALLARCGFDEPGTYPSLAGTEALAQAGLFALVAKRRR